MGGVIAAILMVMAVDPAWQRTLDGMIERAEAERARPRVIVEAEKVVVTPAKPGMEGMIEEVLAQHGLPASLKWVSFVESRFNPLARSPKQAVGMWQFMPGTAQAFGLKVGAVDERLDPRKSTEAAARYLKALYERFGDWKLAFAAYNAGEGRVAEAVARGGSNWMKLLPAETRQYVPRVLEAQQREQLERQ